MTKLSILVAALSLAACSSSEFSSSVNKGSLSLNGGSPSDDEEKTKDRGKPTDENDLNDGSGGDDQNGIDAGEDQDSNSKDDDKVNIDDSETSCHQTLDETKIDFEDADANLPISDLFSKKYGVVFSAGGSTPIARRTTWKGDPELDKSEIAWLCILCKGKPARNRLWDTETEQRVGRRILSTTSAFSTNTVNFEVEWKKPVHQTKFDLLDMDGNESWTIELFDKNGKKIEDSDKVVQSKGYGKNSSNGRTVTIEYSFNEALVSRMVISGRKKSEKYGFGFDNFYTGYRVCR